MNAQDLASDRGTCDPQILRTEADIARTREEVARSVMALKRELARRFDALEWVRRRPVLAVALAFGIGALLGSWPKSDPRKRR